MKQDYIIKYNSYNLFKIIKLNKLAITFIIKINLCFCRKVENDNFIYKLINTLIKK